MHSKFPLQPPAPPRFLPLLQQQERYLNVIVPSAALATGRRQEQSIVLIDMDGALKFHGRILSCLQLRFASAIASSCSHLPVSGLAVGSSCACPAPQTPAPAAGVVRSMLPGHAPTPCHLSRPGSWQLTCTSALPCVCPAPAPTPCPCCRRGGEHANGGGAEDPGPGDEHRPGEIVYSSPYTAQSLSGTHRCNGSGRAISSGAKPLFSPGAHSASFSFQLVLQRVAHRQLPFPVLAGQLPGADVEDADHQWTCISPLISTPPINPPAPPLPLALQDNYPELMW